MTPVQLSPRNRGLAPLVAHADRACVLVVDDSDAQRYAVARALQAEGFEVLAVATGEEALETAARVDLDAVVLDVRLPGIDGLEVCRRLKARASSLLPVMHLSSASTSSEHRTQGLDAGADGYLTHPFDPDELRAAVSALVRLRRNEAERVAQASISALLTDALDALADHVALLAASGDVVAVNRAWSEFALANGYAHAGTGLGVDYCAVCDDAMGEGAEEARAAAAAIRRVLAGESPVEEVDYPCHAPHEERWFRMTVRPVRSPGPVAAIVTHRDRTREVIAARTEATARAAAEAEHRARIESAERIHFQASLLDIVRHAVIATDVEGRVTYWNRCAEEMYGWRAAAALGRSVVELLLPDARHAEGARGLAGALSREARSERRDWTLCRADGTTLQVSATTSPITDASGQIVGLVGASTDVTAERAADAALARAERLQASVLSSVEDGIMGIDARGITTFANRAACAALGYAPEELVGRRLHDMVHARRADGSPYPWQECPVHQSFAGWTVYKAVDEVLWRKDGTPVTVNLVSTPLIEDGHGHGAVLSFRDVSRTRELEAQLRQAQKMEAVGQLAGGIAHDFNNLLTVVSAHSIFLLESLAVGDPRREDVEAIHAASVRAADLTRQLLAFSRKQVVRPRVVNVNRVVEEAHRMLARLLGDEIEIVTSLVPDVARVVVDPGQLDQVLVNLAVNARDAMPDGGCLLITTRNVVITPSTEPGPRVPMPPGDYVLLEVRDTGIGMDAQTQARLFEPFFTTKAPGKGTGLGLATVYGIVKQASGYVLVESALGAGAALQIYLPSVVAAEEAEQVLTAVQAAAHGAETVLVVEDDAAVRELAQRALTRRGYHVLQARDGREAIAIANDYAAPIQLVLSDASLPGMTGADTVSQLRAQRPEIRVLFMSGYADDEVLRRGIEQTTAFIQKPFGPSDLTKAVREVLDG